MIQPQPSPADLLATARSIAAGGPGWGSSWSRSTALLVRQALEDAVSTVWTADIAGLRACPMTSQLICLPHCLGDDNLARRTRQCWNALSNACHAHPYELAPTAGELTNWLDLVDELLRHLRTGAKGPSDSVRAEAPPISSRLPYPQSDLILEQDRVPGPSETTSRGQPLKLPPASTVDVGGA
jgi:hypothetical protein